MQRLKSPLHIFHARYCMLHVLNAQQVYWTGSCRHVWAALTEHRGLPHQSIQSNGIIQTILLCKVMVCATVVAVRCTNFGETSFMLACKLLQLRTP